MPGSKQKRILLCSRLVERKGIQFFIQGVRDLELADWRIDIVGSGPYQSRLQELAAESKTPIVWHGRVDNHDPRLAALYAQATICVMPSERENCPVSILEGMAAGCAVVSTNVTGNPEVLGDCGYLVPPRDALALREALLFLVNDEVLCRSLGTAARLRALEKYDPRQIASRNLEILGDCLDRQEAGS